MIEGARARLSPNALGALYMTIGSLGYVVNDALIRAATDEGLDVYQALCLRAVTMSVMFAAIVRYRGESFAPQQLRGAVSHRVLAELAATALFFGALVQMEFANAQTILLVVPFAVTLAAAVFLGETVTAPMYAAVLTGFVGVLLVVQPATDGFTIWSLAVLAAAGFIVIREFATRRVPDTIPAATVALTTAVGLAAMTAVISAFTGWGEITGRAVLYLALACVCLTIGYVCTIETVRVGDLSVSAPFRYTTLLGAVVLGLLWFDETPNGLTIAGCIVIVLSGLAAIRIEHRAS